jgi:hypothetical protein
VNAELIELMQLVHDGRAQEALKDLPGYLERNPRDVVAWVLLSQIAPRPQVAKFAMQEAARLDPTHPMLRRYANARSGGQQAPPLAASARIGQEMSLRVRSDRLRETSLRLRSQHMDPDALSGPTVGYMGQEEFPALQSARALIWPYGPRHERGRPMGDLLAEGKITRQDLEWARDEAREVRVRQAARVILAHTARLPNIAMTVHEARLIAWPFRRFTRPLGELADEGALKLNDLRRVAWFAADARLRQAARLMIPVLEEQREERQEAPAQPVTTPSPASGARSGHRSVPTTARIRTRPPASSVDFWDDAGSSRQRQLKIALAVLSMLLVGCFGLMLMGIFVSYFILNVW